MVEFNIADLRFNTDGINNPKLRRRYLFEMEMKD